MSPIAELDKVISESETITLQITIPQELFLFYKLIFEAFESISKDLHYKARLAEIRSEERKAEWDRERKQEFDAIKDKMRQFYQACLNTGISDKAAMKKVTVQFKDYSWLRKEFREELKAKRDLEIIRLCSEGLNSFQLSERTGISSSTIRKIILQYSKTGI